jgi:hypothetical protein
MEYTLFYRGSLKVNGSPRDKHELRKYFHPQIKQIWNQQPFLNFQGFYKSSSEPGHTIARKIGDFNFVPLVCQALYLVAKLQITLLRPETPGAIITHGGDIDNRLKTLLDSLKIPSEPTALPNNCKPGDNEDPFYCLLEDDNLVTELSVTTAQLFVPMDKNEVIVLLGVTTVKIGTLMGGMELP